MKDFTTDLYIIYILYISQWILPKPSVQIHTKSDNNFSKDDLMSVLGVALVFIDNGQQHEYKYERVQVTIALLLLHIELSLNI